MVHFSFFFFFLSKVWFCICYYPWFQAKSWWLTTSFGRFDVEQSLISKCFQKLKISESLQAKNKKWQNMKYSAEPRPTDVVYSILSIYGDSFANNRKKKKSVNTQKSCSPLEPKHNLHIYFNECVYMDSSILVMSLCSVLIIFRIMCLHVYTRHLVIHILEYMINTDMLISYCCILFVMFLLTTLTAAI